MIKMNFNPAGYKLSMIKRPNILIGGQIRPKKLWWGILKKPERHSKQS